MTFSDITKYVANRLLDITAQYRTLCQKQVQSFWCGNMSTLPFGHVAILSWENNVLNVVKFVPNPVYFLKSYVALCQSSYIFFVIYLRRWSFEFFPQSVLGPKLV